MASCQEQLCLGAVNSFHSNFQQKLSGGGNWIRHRLGETLGQVPGVSVPSRGKQPLEGSTTAPTLELSVQWLRISARLKNPWCIVHSR
jgi:hypothetical protein